MKNGFRPALLREFLVSDDFHWAILIRPSGAPSTTTDGGPGHLLNYAEVGSPAFQPDAKKPFGFGHGAHLMKARVTHWYLRDCRQATPAS